MEGHLGAPAPSDPTGSRTRRVEGILRATALAIAIAGVVDPGVTMRGAARPRLAIVTQQPAPPAADDVRERLVRQFGRSHEIVAEITSDAAAAIVIGDRYPAEAVAATLPVATVTMDNTPPVRIVSLSAPQSVPAGTVIRVEALLESTRDAPLATDLVVSIGGLEVGRLSHEFKAAAERWTPSIDVVPVGTPPWIVRAQAGPSAARTAVALRREPLAVLVYEPRPSWATTFVRRALESDRRFRVEATSFSSRGVAMRTPGAVNLSTASLDGFEAIIAGGLEQLSAPDAQALDRFMRERGGAVALLPDARVDRGAVHGLMALATTERLLERPEKLATRFGAPAFDASELLVVGGAAPAGNDDVLATAGDGSPVIVSMPHGRGRLLISGAMDAWRYRAAADGAFDRFWQATVAALALAAPPPLEVVVTPPAPGPRERAEVSVRLRSSAPVPVAASVDGIPIRLWPEAEAGVFRGTFTARSAPGRMEMTAMAGGERPYDITYEVLVQDGVAADRGVGAPLALLSASRRGIDVTPQRLGELGAFVRESVNAAAAGVERRPLRASWWLFAFAASLCAEWWLRRRRGLR